MKLTFIGAAHEVTGSCHCLEVNGKKILVDYGMEQGVNLYENAELPVDASDVDYVFDRLFQRDIGNGDKNQQRYVYQNVYASASKQMNIGKIMSKNILIIKVKH